MTLPKIPNYGDAYFTTYGMPSPGPHGPYTIQPCYEPYCNVPWPVHAKLAIRSLGFRVCRVKDSGLCVACGGRLPPEVVPDKNRVRPDVVVP